MSEEIRDRRRTAVRGVARSTIHHLMLAGYECLCE